MVKVSNKFIKFICTVILILLLLPLIPYIEKINVSFTQIQKLKQSLNQFKKEEELIKNLQIERGLSILYLTTTKEKNVIKTFLENQYKNTDEILKKFHNPKLKETLEDLRTSVLHNAVSNLDALRIYTKLIHKLIDSLKIERASDINICYKCYYHILALKDLNYWIDEEGRKRAVVSSLLSLRYLEPNLYKKFLIVYGSSNTYKKTFEMTESFSKQVLNYLNKLESDPSWEEATKIDNLLVEGKIHQISLLPLDYFLLQTKKINNMFNLSYFIINRLETLLDEDKKRLYIILTLKVIVIMLLILAVAYIYYKY